MAKEVIDLSFQQAWRSFARRYEQFVSRQGFALLTLICVGVITASALWTRQASVPQPVPTPPVSDAASAAQLWQQSLQEASTPTPYPTQHTLSWHSPLEKVVVLRAFDGSRMVRSSVTGIWQLHDAVDLAAETGAIVRAMADGTVLQTTEEGLLGASVRISHPGGYEALYGGLSLVASIRAGDPVEAGQTIGFAGNSVLAESDMEPHLHLRITRDGKAVDPLLLIP